MAGRESKADTVLGIKQMTFLETPLGAAIRAIRSPALQMCPKGTAKATLVMQIAI